MDRINITDLHASLNGGDVRNDTDPLDCWLPACHYKLWYMCGIFILTLVNLTVGTVANCILCFKIIKERSYHTTTFTCIFILALSDIGACISLTAASLDLNSRTIYATSISEIFEAVDRSVFFVMATAVIWSNENTVLFAIERYSLMKNPIKYARFQTPKRIVRKSLFCLLMTLALNICVISIAVQLICKRMDLECLMPYFGALGILFWVTTLILLVVIHRAKIRRLRKTNMGSDVHIHRLTSRMTKSIYAILVNYFISNGPFLVIDILKFLELFCTINWIVNGPLLFNICFFFNSIKFTANPFIYFFCSKSLSKGCCHFKKKPLIQL